MLSFLICRCNTDFFKNDMKKCRLKLQSSCLFMFMVKSYRWKTVQVTKKKKKEEKKQWYKCNIIFLSVGVIQTTVIKTCLEKMYFAKSYRLKTKRLKKAWWNSWKGISVFLYVVQTKQKSSGDQKGFSLWTFYCCTNQSHKISAWGSWFTSNPDILWNSLVTGEAEL